MLKPLLIEIGLEELPAIPFLKELPNIETKWQKILQENNLLSNFEIFYTPRRVTIYHREFLTKQADSKEELYGAPVEIAIKDGSPTKAGEGFAKKCGVAFEELKRAKKGSKEVLYFEKEIEGRESKLLLEDMINRFLKSLHFGKTMRWAERDLEFIRPIRSSIVLLGEEFLELNIFNVKSSRAVYPHRQVSYEPIEFSNILGYFETLEKNGVILYPDRREKRILEQFKKLEEQHNISIEIDTDLLAEVVAITEYPTALVGEFDREFLTLPKEAIITSMKEHQRYFAVYKDGEITNKFIVVSNAKTEKFEQIVKGNEKVLRARLSDGLFFYNNDLKNGFDIEGLKSLVFVQGLGSLFEKVQREKEIAKAFYDLYSEKVESSKEDIIKASEISKADLMTEMVYEFTELQGVMGSYYARAFGENDFIADSIKEQYLPDGEESELPSNYFSSILAMANKLDNILALFSVNKIPTGTKDPFALRRSAIGIIKIVLEKNLDFDLEKTINSLAKNYQNLDEKKVIEFFLDRIYQIFNTTNPSIVKAVLVSNDRDILRISKKITALDTISQSESFKEMFSTFKRVANITKDLDLNSDLTIDSNLFESDEEKALFSKFEAIEAKEFENYEEELDSKFSLKPELDKFFDNVLVNAKDEKIKINRKNLIGSIYKSFKAVADIKEISS